MSAATSNRPADWQDGFYVFDRFGHSMIDAYVSGPFVSVEDAREDGRQVNIAGDCFVAQVIGAQLHYAPEVQA